MEHPAFVVEESVVFTAGGLVGSPRGTKIRSARRCRYCEPAGCTLATTVPLRAAAGRRGGRNGIGGDASRFPIEALVSGRWTLHRSLETTRPAFECLSVDQQETPFAVRTGTGDRGVDRFAGDHRKRALELLEPEFHRLEAFDELLVRGEWP